MLPHSFRQVNLTRMVSHSQFAITAILTVCAYYSIAWFLFGRDRKIGTIVPLYDPPRQLSPGMLRYIWKQNFDDRVFWAGVLLIAKGLATLHQEDGVAKLRACSPSSRTDLPNEEKILQDELMRGHTRKGVSISMVDPRTMLAVGDMASSLRRDAVGHWFTEIVDLFIAGAAISAVALCIVAGPRNREQWGVLALGLAVMSPGAFYLFFLSLRAWDLLRAARGKCDRAVLRRGALVFAMLVPCLASITLGAVVLGGTFGRSFLATALFLAVLNILLLQWMKAPTVEGAEALAEIEGFRLFLKSVERLPMQRLEPPGDHAGLYEKYLPYAVALEVEQIWGDRFIALTSTSHENAGLPNAESFYLRDMERQAAGDNLQTRASEGTRLLTDCSPSVQFPVAMYFWTSSSSSSSGSDPSLNSASWKSRTSNFAPIWVSAFLRSSAIFSCPIL